MDKNVKPMYLPLNCVDSSSLILIPASKHFCISSSVDRVDKLLADILQHQAPNPNDSWFWPSNLIGWETFKGAESNCASSMGTVLYPLMSAMLLYLNIQTKVHSSHLKDHFRTLQGTFLKNVPLGTEMIPLFLCVCTLTKFSMPHFIWLYYQRIVGLLLAF